MDLLTTLTEKYPKINPKHIYIMISIYHTSNIYTAREQIKSTFPFLEIEEIRDIVSDIYYFEYGIKI